MASKKAAKANKKQENAESQQDTKIKTLESRIQNLEMKITILNDQLTNSRAERGHHQRNVISIQTKLDSVERDIKDLLGRQSQLIAENENCVTEYEQQIQDLSSSLREQTKLITEQTEANLLNSRRLKECDAVFEERRKLEMVVKTQQETMEKQIQEISRAVSEAECLKLRCQESSERIVDLELAVEDSTELCIVFGDTCLLKRSSRYTIGLQPPNLPANNLVCTNEEKLVWCGSSEGRFVVHCLDLEQRSWSTSPISGNSSLLRRNFSACYYNQSKLLLFGGLKEKDLTSEVSVLNSDLMTLHTNDLCRTEIKPNARERHASCSTKVQLFIFGGKVEGELDNELWIFDTEQHEWSQLLGVGDEPSPREGATISVTEDGRRLYLFGGFDGDACLNDFYTLDIGRRTWTAMNSEGEIRPSPRMHGVSSIVMHYVLIGSGKSQGPNGVGIRNLGDLYAFDLTNSTWELLQSGSWVSDYPWMHPSGQYSAFSRNRFITLKPDRHGRLSQIGVLEFLLPEHIHNMRIVRKKETQIQTKLEITKMETVSHAIEVDWAAPSLNADRIDHFKVMITNKTGTVTTAYEGKAHTCTIRHLLQNTSYTLCVKAVYDDSSFLWSEAISCETRA